MMQSPCESIRPVPSSRISFGTTLPIPGLAANGIVDLKTEDDQSMDLVTGAKRVVVAMQHTAKGKPKIIKRCTLPLTSVRAVDLVVTELAAISFEGGRATLRETAPGVSVQQVLAATEASLVVPPQVPQMQI